MPRSLTEGIKRPSCPDPDHAGGRIWLGGYYATGDYHQRPRWWCAPPADDRSSWKRHRFAEPMRRRHASPGHPLGKRCELCEHMPDHDEGPLTPRGCTYTIHEVARALVSIGEGLTYRTTSYKTRRHAHPPRADDDERSDHPQLAMDYLDAFGDLIYREKAEIEWPEVLILDALPQHEKDMMAGGAKKKGGRRAFSILAAYGYRNGKGKLWRLGVYGAEDAYEWECFLRTMPGTPRWVVCDQAGAIARAVRSVWPEATIYNCEWHITHAGLRWVHPKQLGDRYREIVGLVKGCTEGQTELDALGAALATLPVLPPSLQRWYDRQRRKLPELWAKRQPDMPRGSGPLEERLDELNRMLGKRRRFRFRNLGRLERLLGLMLVELNRTADERFYANVIQDYLDKHGGTVKSVLTDWRALADRRSSGSSVRELARRARIRIAREKALVEQRKLNRQIERAWRAEQRRLRASRPARPQARMKPAA